MPTGIDDLTIIFDRDTLNDELIDQVCNEIQTEVNPDHLEWISDYAIIMLVGEGMRDRIGVMRDIATPVSREGISLRMVNQGASEISIMLGTAAKDADRAVAAIYDYFFKQEGQGE